MAIILVLLKVIAFNVMFLFFKSYFNIPTVGDKGAFFHKYF